MIICLTECHFRVSNNLFTRFNNVVDYDAKFSVWHHCFGYCDEDNEITGVYADLDFQEGDLVLKDQMLFGVQHSANKVSFIHIVVVCCELLSL